MAVEDQLGADLLAHRFGEPRDEAVLLEQLNRVTQGVLQHAVDEAEEIRAAAEALLFEADAQADEILAGARAQAEEAFQARLQEAARTVHNAHVAAGASIRTAQAAAGDTISAAQAAATETIRSAQRQAAQVRAQAAEVLSDAQTQRETLVSGTLERIAELTTRLMGMAQAIVDSAEDPSVARSQLAQFILELSDSADQLSAAEPTAIG